MESRGRYALLLAISYLISFAAHAQSTTANFDSPAPSGAADSLFEGTYQGINFGTGQWRWSGPYSADPSNNIYFANSTGTSRSFTFSPSPRILNGMSVYTTTAGTLTVSDGVNPTVTRSVPVNSLVVVSTGWSAASTTVTVAFSAGWALGVDDIMHSSAGPADTVPPTVSMTAPAGGSTVSGLTSLTATASDNVAVAGVQFYVDGTAVGLEDTVAPYAVAWDSSTVVNGAHTITARARDTSNLLTTSSATGVTVSNVIGSGFGYSLRFNGNGTGDIDRVKIPVDDPTTSLPGPPVDVGATDFTLEFWIAGTLAENPSATVACGANDNWILGNIVVDRDRFEQDRKFGVSIAGGRVVFGVTGTGLTNQTTICGTSNVLDGQWHHIAVERRRSDGWMWLFVDGAMQAQVDGPDGDISYPDNGVPLSLCGPGGDQPCTNSDPFIVIGAEKHDAGTMFPSYRGQFDELRISTTLRYAANFSRPTTPFSPDANTVGLYHFDEGQGDYIYDSSGAFGTSGPSIATRRYGGTPTGPEWVAQTPFTSQPASLVGEWAGLYNWPVIAVHVALLNNGQVLVLDGGTDLNIGGSSARLWNPVTNTFTAVPNTRTDMFCSAHTFLSDGRLLVSGGNVNLYIGLRDTNIFDPVTATWSRGGDLSDRRWYPTTLRLGDGRVLAISGSTNCNTCIVQQPEIYNPSANTWTVLPNAPLFTPTYPYMFLLPDGRVIVPASDEEPMETYTLDINSQTWTVVDPNVVEGGSAVQYQPGRIMKTGTAADVDIASYPTVRNTYVLDMNQPTPQWRATQPMAFPRGLHTLTMLPDGTVLVTGGGRTSDGVNLQQGVLQAELWSPDTETWTTMSTAQLARLYHSTALLLPDGRVLSAGGGRFVGFTNVDQLNAEIYSPPYLFRGERPKISSAPTAPVQYGSTFFVGTATPETIQRVTLVSPGAVTHEVNMNQSFLELTFTATTGGLNVVMPSNTNLVTPGYYMLFLINSNGVPSVASFIQVLPSGSSRPAPTTTSISPSTATSGGAAFTLTVNGTNFVAGGSTVQWNGTNRTTTFVSTTQLQAAITAADIASAGTATVTVVTSAPGGGTSNPQTFTTSGASNPVPTTTSISPTSAIAGGAAFTLTVNGTGFVSGQSAVRFNGVSRTTTFVSSTRLTAAIQAADIAAAGTASITVFTPTPGGGTSNAQTLAINNPAPVLSSLSPTSAAAGGAAFTLTVNGSGFVQGQSVVRWNGSNRTTSFASSTQLAVGITAADIAAAGTASVTVFTPTPGGGTSTAQTFTMTSGNNPVPTTTSISPVSATAGGAAFSLTVNGTGFVSGQSTVQWNGSGRTTTFVSATQLTAAITAADIAAAGTATVAVLTSAPGGGTSNTQSFTINASGGGGSTPNLVAAYSFNVGSGTTVADASGNGNNGTLANVTWTTAGRFGAAAVFNGTSSMITVPDSSSLDLTTGMTLEAWVYPTVLPSGWRTIVEKEASGGVSYYLHASGSGNLPTTGVTIGTTEQSLSGGTRLAANTWVHLAATYDGTTQRLYVNGTQVASRAQTGSIAVSGSPLRIGANTVYGEYFQGRIDEVRVYNRALTQAEIQTDMNAGVTP